MPRFYAELCVFIEAENLLYAEDIARQAAERADRVSGISSVSVNLVDEQEEDPDAHVARRDREADDRVDAAEDERAERYAAGEG